ncbi:MAG TPA: alkaline phosphatase family protein, partial [Bacteroidia bacterium]|nr:alkaline phosphatase family protein [Bacteroidia bacterium]
YMTALPEWVNTFNARKLPQSYLSKDWETLLPIDQYTESIADDNKYEATYAGEDKPVFPHHLPLLMDKNGKLGMIRATPFGNSLTREFAQATILGENLGKGSATDFLCVSFSSTDYIGHQFGPNSVEVEDCYLRLDKELAEFFSFLDNYLGKNNTLLFLTADHGAVENPQYLKDNNIPAGYFSEGKMTDSLKKVMRKIYGDSLVLCYENDQVFLDRAGIAKKGLNKSEIEKFTASFIMGFKGVEMCMTASDLQSNEYTQKPQQLIRNGFNFQRSGDVCVVLQPSWFSEFGKKGTTHGTSWSYDTHVPMYWWGWKIKNGSSDALMNITDVAPTVCNFLNIQFPDGCTGQPITGMVK